MKLVSKYIIITILLFISTQIKAQSFKGGFFGGLAMSQIDGDKIDGYNRPNLKIGILSELKKQRRKSHTYGFELYYQGKGSNTWTPKGSTGPDNRIRLHTIEILPYYKYFLSKKVYIRGGIAFGYLLKADKKIEGEIADFKNDFFNKVTFDGNIGIGAKISKLSYIQVDLQYSILSIADVIEEDFIFNKTGMYNNIIAFSIYTIFK